MALAKLTCHSCGETVEVSPRFAKKRKFCNICQVVRDGARLLAPARECKICTKQFWPVRAASYWDKCPDCAVFLTLEKRMNSPECKICGERKPPAEGLSETCLACVSSNETYRNEYVKLLNEIVANRVKNLTSKSVS